DDFPAPSTPSRITNTIGVSLRGSHPRLFAAASHETPEIPDEQDQPEDRSHRDERRHAEAAKRGDQAHRTLHALVAAGATPLAFPVRVADHGAPGAVGAPSGPSPT